MIGEQVQDRLWAALRAHPGATAAELATHARISRTKASTLLAAWAADGSVTAAPGATPRAARQWTATETPAPAPADTGSPAGSRRPDPTEQADPEPAPASVTAQPDAPSEDEPATSPPTAEAPRRAPSRNRSGSVRLAAGALRGLVEEFLTDHPGEHGSVEIGRAIGRSSGAVANALERLVADGWAERTGDRPKRYRATGTGADATG
ncbi:hypothetical protein [Pseudonocardia sp.]|uniref:hypothetical protein n=1 Tax=Pseudonocardia sp. TaxID=60912 RepID=UPI003D0EC6DD